MFLYRFSYYECITNNKYVYSSRRLDVGVLYHCQFQDFRAYPATSSAMEEKSELLHCRQVKGITYGSEVIACACRDGFFLFADEHEELHTFDSATLQNVWLPARDKKIRGTIVALDFSPSRRYGAVSFTDGSIQVYDLEHNKLGKVVTKAHGSFATSILFVDDNMFVAGDGNTLYGYRFISALGFLSTIRELVIAQFQSPIRKVSAPPVYRYVAGANRGARCVASSFTEKIAVCTQKGVAYVKITPEFKISLLSQFEHPMATATFSIVNADLCLMAIGKKNSLQVYTINTKQECQEVFSAEVEIDPVHIAFMSETVVMAFDEDFEGVIVSLADKTNVRIKSPYGSGCFAKGTHEFFVFQMPKLWMLALQSFRNKMEELREKGDLETAISFCRKALEGDTQATIGLPVNQAQKALVIERSLSDMLTDNGAKQLTEEGADPSAVASWLVKLNIELNMQDWLVNDGVALFENHGCAKALFAEILKEDPKAQLFDYSPAFVEKLLACEPDFPVHDFIMALPGRVAPVSVLLQWGLKEGDGDFMADVYFEKVRSIVDGLAILANADKLPRICHIMMEEKEKLNLSIKWLFSVVEGRFPIVVKLIGMEDRGLVTELFTLIQDHILETKKPFKIDDYANAMVCAITDAGLALDDPLEKKIEQLILDHNIGVHGSALIDLLDKIFTHTVTEPDNREQLLIQMFTFGVPLEFEERLLPLCDSHGFQRAKYQIRHDTRNFEDAVKEMLADENINIMETLISLTRKEPEALPSLEKAIIKHATVLALKDAAGLAAFCAEFLGEDVMKVINEIQEETVQSHFIHKVVKLPEYATLQLPDEISVSFGTFMCQHYPTDVRHYVMHRENLMRQLLPACEKYDIFDGCAIIYNYLTDCDKVRLCMVRFIETQLVLYIQGKIELDMASTTNFISNFVEAYLRDRASYDDTERFARDMVRAYILPLYALEVSECPENKMEEVCESLRRLCGVVENVITFPKLLEMLIVDYQELKFGTLKAAILSIMNDYDYDVDQNLTMSLLYHEDEVNAHSSYVESLVHGIAYNDTHCSACHGSLFGVGSAIQTFSCGHVFHCDPACLPKDVCPICHPVEKLNEDVASPIQSVDAAAGRIQLMKFDKLASRAAIPMDIEDQRMAITIAPNCAFPI